MPDKINSLSPDNVEDNYMTVLSNKLFDADEHSPKRQTLKITLIYFFIGSLWILLSDKLVNFLIKEQPMVLLISLMKGWFYVGITSALIYILVYAAIKKVTVAKNKINNINVELEKKILELNKSNALFSAIIESPPQVIIFALDNDYCYSSYNQNHKDAMHKILGKEIQIGLNMLDVIGGHQYRKKVKANFDRALAGESFTMTEESEDESMARMFWQDYYSPIFADDGQVIGLTCIILNITELEKAEASLIENERLLSISQKIAHIGSYVIDIKTKTWQGSPEINDIFGIDKTYPRTLESWFAFIHPDSRPNFLEYHAGVKSEKKRFDLEFKIIRSNDGEERWVQGYGDFEHNEQNQPLRVIGTIQDITKRKKADEEIIYLSYHDKLTGLYNRRFYEDEIIRLDKAENLPIAMIIGDVNGLKMINDAFGHDKGDELLQKAAASIQSACRAGDIVARWGGDEFVILMPKTTIEEAAEMVQRIKNHYADQYVNVLNVSISFGLDAKKEIDEDILKVLKSAEDYMYKHKIIDNAEMKGNVISTIINTLHVKNPREEQHSKRVSEICANIGKAIGLADSEVRGLKVVGHLHDIGKIAIDERLLNKPGKLSKNEFDEIKRHPEIGYRIISSSYDMSEFAEGILSHHERWDGKGYPNGLRGEAIPRIARIIAIADSYDAMTSGRPYRAAMAEEEVIREIRLNAGIQFDPEIARIFVEIVLGKIWREYLAQGCSDHDDQLAANVSNDSGELADICLKTVDI